MMKALVLSVFPAPYRVDVFKGIGEYYNIALFFERLKDENRNKDWFVNNNDSEFLVLNNKESITKFKDELRNINKYDFVLVYDYSTFTAMKLMLKCIVKKIPYVINCDGAFIKSHKIKAIIKRFFVSKATACLASGEHASLYFLNYGAKEENIYFHKFSALHEEDILKSPVNEIEKESIRKKLGLENKKTVISIGQFIYRKGYDVLLSSWLNVNKDYQLIIIGGGEKNEEYLEFINKNKLTNVIILGFKDKSEVFEYYKASDLFVLPTREDVWGLVINEAMACGLPVITTDRCIAGLELVKDDENGYIVPIEDVEQLSEKISYVLGNDDLCEKMQINNIKKISKYTINNVVKSHISTFEKILGEN